MDQTSLLAPSGHSSFVVAASWLADVLVGDIATAVAIIAVAGLGLLALAGRVDLRRSASVLIGCFILFGARSLSAAFMTFATGGTAPSITSQPAAPIVFAPPPAQPATPQVYDPYAGAAVPPQ